MAGDIDGRVSFGLVPGMPWALKMSPKAVRHWLSSASAWFGMHEHPSARIGSAHVYLPAVCPCISCKPERE